MRFLLVQHQPGCRLHVHKRILEIATVTRYWLIYRDGGRTVGHETHIWIGDCLKRIYLHKMQLLFVFVFFLFSFTRSSNVENESDILSSVDIIAFDYSQQVSQHWDCPQISDRAGKAEETRLWRTVVPDARIKETVPASGNRTLQRAEQYKWIKEDVLNSGSAISKSDPSMQNMVVLLGMRKPSFGDCAAPVKLLYSRNKRVSKHALSVMLPRLEQSKNKIMDWLARNQAVLPIPSSTPEITEPLANHCLQVPQAVNYHPRVFRHAHFSTGDLIAWMALVATSHRKSYADVFKFFKIMAQSFLPGFDISLGAVPKKYAGEPTKTIYLHRPFQYVPAGSDLAFYFDGNRGKFLGLQGDSVVLNRPEGIVDGQQHAALVLFSHANADASNLEMHRTKLELTMRKIVFEALEEKAFALHISPEATKEEVQASGVSTIRNLAARLEWDSSLKAHRELFESKPKLLGEWLPKKLVKLVIDYFDDGAYSIIVSTHSWAVGNINEIAVDSARVYLVTESKGIKGLEHSLGTINEDERRCIDFGDPRWSNYLLLTSSHDGRYVSFSHSYKAATHFEAQAQGGTKWRMQGSSNDEKPKRVAFDGEHLYCGILSRDGRTLCSFDAARNPVTYAYKIEETDPAVGFMKFKFNGELVAVSGKGNRAMVMRNEWLEIYDMSKDALKLVYKIGAADFEGPFALNEEGSEAAFAITNSELQIVNVDTPIGNPVGRSTIVTVSESLGSIGQLVYDDENKLHVCHDGKISLFDPSTKKLILLEASQRSQRITALAISPDANYIAILIGLDGRNETERFKKHQTVVKRKFRKTDKKKFLGY